ncbi:MAG TPA: hypothetical protein VLP43_03815 [Solirubrobacteraceae bacterium]|nr:hypothetical protein [Solirubrobacteraceae bacterium]
MLDGEAMSAPSHTAPRSSTSDRRRLAGIDPQTVRPSLLVLALAILMSVVLPSINSHTSYRHPIRRGDVAKLADGVTLVPAARWDLASGALVGRARSQVGNTATTELVNGSVRFTVQAASFAATPAALLRRVKQISSELDHTRGRGVATRVYTVRTRQGAVGVGQDFAGVSRQGSVVAFVFRLRGQTTGEGVEIVVSGPRGQISRGRGDIVAMIRSIRTAS